MLFIELIDWALDWLAFVLVFYAADLQFQNDPDHVLRTFIMVLCGLSTVFWFFEGVLFCANKHTFCSLAKYFTVGHLLIEDGTQVVLYSILASGTTNSGAEGHIVQVILIVAAGIQSLLFFFQKGYGLLPTELLSEHKRSAWRSDARVDPGVVLHLQESLQPDARATLEHHTVADAQSCT